MLLAGLLHAGQLRGSQGIRPHHGLQGVQLHIALVLLAFQAQVLKQVSLQTSAALHIQGDTNSIGSAAGKTVIVASSV